MLIGLHNEWESAERTTSVTTRERLEAVFHDILVGVPADGVGH